MSRWPVLSEASILLLEYSGVGSLGEWTRELAAVDPKMLCRYLRSSPMASLSITLSLEVERHSDGTQRLYSPDESKGKLLLLMHRCYQTTRNENGVKPECRKMR